MPAPRRARRWQRVRGHAERLPAASRWPQAPASRPIAEAQDKCAGLARGRRLVGSGSWVSPDKLLSLQLFEAFPGVHQVLALLEFLEQALEQRDCLSFLIGSGERLRQI